MSGPDHDEATLRRLRSCRLVEPSAALRDRILAAASLALPRPEAAGDELPWTPALRPVLLAAAALVVLVAGNAVLQTRLPPPADLSPLFGDGTEALATHGAAPPVSRDRQRRVLALILLGAAVPERDDPAGDGRPWRQGSDCQGPDRRPAALGAPPHREGVRR